jgi:hypothetical protein
MLILFAPGIPRERFVTERRNLRIGFDPCRTGVASSTPGMTSTWSELQVSVGYQPVPERAPGVQFESRSGVMRARGRCLDPRRSVNRAGHVRA